MKKNAIVIFWKKEIETSSIIKFHQSISKQEKTAVQKPKICWNAQIEWAQANIPKKAQRYRLNSNVNAFVEFFFVMHNFNPNVNWMKWSHYKSSKCSALREFYMLQMCITHFHFHVHFYQFILLSFVCIVALNTHRFIANAFLSTIVL